jgi:hypothetical protein
MEGGMSLSYCSLHERLFDPQRQTWVTWPHLYVAMVPPFCDLLASCRIDASRYTVSPAPCDRCTAIARQAVDEYIEPL